MCVADWEDDRYMDWADQERLVRQDVEEIERRRRKTCASIWREEEYQDE